MLVVTTSTLAAGLCLVATEVGLRLMTRDAYYIWPPNLHATFSPRPEALPGVRGESHIYVNDWGIRGPDFSPDDSLRVLAIGGSTTESLYLDESETWPHLLQDRLNTIVPRPSVWVGNAGKSGHASAHHVLQVEKLLDQFPRIDVVLVLVGTNDMMRTLQSGGDDPLTQPELDVAFARVPRNATPGIPFFKRTELWRLVKSAKDRWLEDYDDDLVQDSGGEVFETMRARRRKATVLHEDLPAMKKALARYRDNLNAIVDAATAHQTQVILVTQPSLWSDDLTPEAERLIWMGRVGRYMRDDSHEYYAIGTIADGMAAYNDVLLQVCADRGLRCIDLAAEVPRSADFFYDDVHFNEQGAERVAAVMTERLLAILSPNECCLSLSQQD